MADFIGYINFEDWPSIYTIDDALTAVKDTLDKVLPEDLAHVFGTAWERRMRKIEVLNTVRCPSPPPRRLKPNSPAYSASCGWRT